MASTVPEAFETVQPAMAPAQPDVEQHAWKPRAARVLLFVWTLLIACPIRYWPLTDLTVDNTWVFALNYGAAHGLAFGRDLIWTTGPLGYLAFPQDIGNNLSRALLFQSIVWAVLSGVLADVFFRAQLRLRNLTYFAIFFSLSAPLYWFDYMGLENLLLAGMLVLLAVSRLRGGTSRFVCALVIAGIIPLIKLTGGMLAAGAILGFLMDRCLRIGSKVWRGVMLASIVPAAVTGAGYWLFLPSFSAFAKYVKGSLEMVSGYSVAMSLRGDPMEFAGVAETLIGIGVFLFVRTKSHRQLAWFLTLLLALPLLTSFKHGFVRQDVHVINFFCFAGLALAIIALVLPLSGGRALVGFLVALNFGILSLEYMFARLDFGEAMGESSGIRGASLAIDAFNFEGMRAALRSKPPRPEALLEPEIRAIIGDTPVASLSVIYVAAATERLNLRLYPVPQRYAAFTPYLDELNSSWIRDQGPRFLLFDGNAIDSRHPWAETPAMWLEIYRWYDTRRLGSRNLLLERRPAPRFENLGITGSAEISLEHGIDLPESQELVFWTLACPTSASGRLQKVLRIPELTMETGTSSGRRGPFRVVPEVLRSPVLGNGLPTTLAEFAALFEPVSKTVGHSAAPTGRITFGGSGLSSYGPACHVDFLAPAY